MHAYFSTERHEKNGIRFEPILISNHSSFGQRCVALGGAVVGSYVTIGAETVLPFNFCAEEGATAFGSPPIEFTSTALFKDIIDQSQSYSRGMLSDRSLEGEGDETNIDSDLSLGCIETLERNASTAQDENGPSRMQDIGTGKFFWLYIITMILIQGCLPLVIGGAYGGIYYLVTTWLGQLSFEFLLATIPLIYIAGSIILMLVMKMMQIAGGNFSIGTADFFSFRYVFYFAFKKGFYETYSCCMPNIPFPSLYPTRAASFIGIYLLIWCIYVSFDIFCYSLFQVRLPVC